MWNYKIICCIFFLLENEICHNLWLISDVSLPTCYTCLEMVTLSNFKDKKYSHIKLFLVGLSCTENNKKKPLFKNESQLYHFIFHFQVCKGTELKSITTWLLIIKNMQFIYLEENATTNYCPCARQFYLAVG